MPAWFLDVWLILFYISGFYYLFKDIEDENITTFKTIWGTIMQLVQMTFGEFKVSDDILLFSKVDYQ